MKTLVAILVLALAVPTVTPGCSTPPSERVVAVQTLKAVATTAEAAVALSAQLYRDQKITAQQARDVMQFYDGKFQPAFRVAVTAARSDLNSFASPDLANLASQLISLVGSFTR